MKIIMKLFFFWVKIISVLIKKMNDIEELIEFWDQDILNHYFDGKYNELNKNLNYNLYLTEENSKLQASNKSLNEMIFLSIFLISMFFSLRETYQQWVLENRE